MRRAVIYIFTIFTLILVLWCAWLAGVNYNQDHLGLTAYYLALSLWNSWTVVSWSQIIRKEKEHGKVL